MAEALYRDRVVEPFMEEAISAAALRDSPRGLRGLLDRVLSFIPDQAQLLVAVTRREHGYGEGAPSRALQFLPGGRPLMGSNGVILSSKPTSYHTCV